MVPSRGHVETPRKIADDLHSTSTIPHKPWPNISVAQKAKKFGYWNERLFTPDQIEFESDLEGPSQLPKLVDHPDLSKNSNLWFCLMGYRCRRYGQAGFSMFWKAIRSRGVQLPVGRSADTLWISILEFGFKDQSILEDIYRYANDLYDSTGRSWSELYVTILEHVLRQGGALQVTKWHKRLVERYPPTPASFVRLAGNVFRDGGNLEGFRKVYLGSVHRNIYRTIMPILLSRQDFQTAFRWHFFLLNAGDLPPNSKLVEPLITYLAIYDRPKAVKVTKSLVASGVPFYTKGSIQMAKNTKISREIMNEMHGEVFNIGAKNYNDRLGARWFATKWIPLDIALNATHALGVEVIGPLTLQALALREPEPEQIVRRLSRIEQLGISIGNSAFSRALTAFARKKDVWNLDLLLQSDQHPDVMENWKLQEALIASYARNGDWVKFRHAIAVQASLASNPTIEEYNIILRSDSTNGDKRAILRTLEDMRVKAIPAKPMTIRYILRNILASRRKGKAVVASSQNIEDLNLAISILKQLMNFNCFVPVTSWKEIIRRLGMMGRLDELDRLCIWLAAWYNPESNLRRQSLLLSSSPRLPDKESYLVPAQVPTSHPLHPLRILFSDSLQKAVVEWGFIHAGLKDEFGNLRSRAVLTESSSVSSSYTRGILLLHQLRSENVAINTSSVKRAIFTRLAILYGPGRSNRRRNEVIASRNVLPIGEMVKQINQAWGGEVFESLESLEYQIKTGTKPERKVVSNDSMVREAMAPENGHD